MMSAPSRMTLFGEEKNNNNNNKSSTKMLLQSILGYKDSAHIHQEKSFKHCA